MSIKNFSNSSLSWSSSSSKGFSVWGETVFAALILTKDVRPFFAEEINTSPELKYGSLFVSSIDKSVSSFIVSMSDALTVLKINFVFSWAVIVSSNKVGLWVARIKNTPYFLPSCEISRKILFDGVSKPFGAKLCASSVIITKGGK